MITLQNDTLGFTFPEVARQVRPRVEDHIEALVAELPPEWDRGLFPLSGVKTFEATGAVKAAI